MPADNDLYGEMLEMFGRPSWMNSAACRGVGPAIFFPDRGGAGEAEQAMRYCAICPVRPQCLRYVLEGRERQGIWGGSSEKDRRVMLRSWARGEAAVAPPIPLPEQTRLLSRPPRRRPFGCGKNCAHCRAVVEEATGAQPLVLEPPAARAS